MATAAQSAASRANSLQSTGPATEEGKQASSRNAVTLGLFTENDYLRPGEADEYARFCDAFRSELNPEGAAEETLVTLIVSSSWRIRRCAMVEARLAPQSDLDPMQDDSCSGLQNSVDRARSRAFNLLHRAMADLRRLQTDKHIRFELVGEHDTGTLDLTDYRAVTRALGDNATQLLRTKKINGLDTFENALARTIDPPQPAAASFCNEHSATPRNASCPCGSGEKYKRCCGKNAPPVLSNNPPVQHHHA